MKLGLVGAGYWGNIILKNIEKYSNDILIYDIKLKQDAYNGYDVVNDVDDLLDRDAVFIIVPATQHYETCKKFLKNNIKVFCEKPLTTDKFTSKELYDIALNSDNILMVDWVFTFNSNINYLKKLYKTGALGDIRSVSMNRLNFGPERFDVNSRWDLASHDVSILQYVFDKKPVNITWHDYKKNARSYQEDSAVGFIQYDNFHALINTSWYFLEKNRDCVFEFDRGIIRWDDTKNLLVSNDIELNPPHSNKQPLELAIETFFEYKKDDVKKQQTLTNDIMEILEK